MQTVPVAQAKGGLKSAIITTVDIVLGHTFFVISYSLRCEANRIAAVKTLCKSLLPMPLYRPDIPS
jgi:hypothetical protein